MLIGSICLLLRWGAMDAEAYPEASKDVLQILWGISISTPDQACQWERARISALEALAQYEVNFMNASMCVAYKFFPILMVRSVTLIVLRHMYFVFVITSRALLYFVHFSGITHSAKTSRFQETVGGFAIF